MDQEQLTKQIVAEVLKSLGGTPSACAPKCDGKVTAADYPLGEKKAESIKSVTGKSLADMKIEQVISGELTAKDLRIAPETLEMQAQVAESIGRDAFAGNLRRAAELIPVPDARLLEIYNALRPYRSTKDELLDIAKELEETYGAKVSASLVKEAAEVYEKRGRLKTE